MKTRYFFLAGILSICIISSPLYALDRKNLSLQRSSSQSKVSSKTNAKITPKTSPSTLNRSKTRSNLKKHTAPRLSNVKISLTPEQMAAGLELKNLVISTLNSQCQYPLEYTIKNKNNVKVDQTIWLKFWSKEDTENWDVYYSTPIGTINASEQKTFSRTAQFEVDRKYIRLTLHYPRDSEPLSEVSAQVPYTSDVSLKINNAKFNASEYAVSIQNNTTTPACTMQLQAYKATVAAPDTWYPFSGHSFDVAPNGTSLVSGTLPTGDDANQYRLFKFQLRRNHITYDEKIVDTRSIKEQLQIKADEELQNVLK